MANNTKKSTGKLEICSISPVRQNTKHEATPLKSKNKTSRKDQGIDVHTCSTPRAKQSEISNSSLNSPSGSIPYSQENYPDVIWDYTSPKLPKGSKRREIKITVEEFLKNLTQRQVPECKTQAAHYIKLLENWMTNETTDTSVKMVQRNIKKETKKRSRRVMNEIKEFMESIQMQNKDNNAASNLRVNTEKSDAKAEYMTSPSKAIAIDRKSFIEDGNDCDSTEELWGDMDNSFIVKATQEMEVSSPPKIMCSQNSEVVSTIPDTISSTSNVSKCVLSLAEQNKAVPDKSLCSAKVIVDSKNLTDHQAEFLSQLINYDWDSVSDDEWDNGFLVEDDDWSQIPDEVLLDNSTGTANISACNSSLSNEVLCCDTEQSMKPSDFSVAVAHKIETVDTMDESSTAVYEETCFDGTFEPDSADIFSNFEDANFSIEENFGDENFGDESILCKPEVLSWIDEVENKLSQNQKCTPEEIEKKKDEALRRRKKKQSP